MPHASDVEHVWFVKQWSANLTREVSRRCLVGRRMWFLSSWVFRKSASTAIGAFLHVDSRHTYSPFPNCKLPATVPPPFWYHAIDELQTERVSPESLVRLVATKCLFGDWNQTVVPGPWKVRIAETQMVEVGWRISCTRICDYVHVLFGRLQWPVR